LNYATVLQRESPESLRRQIYEEWRAGILSGRFRPGDRVPSTRELAASLGVSRSTVSEAWDQLISEGYLETARGSGTFVCRELPDNLLKADAQPSRRPGHARTKLSRYAAALTGDFRHAPAAPGVISFPPGVPDRDSFPFALWRRLLTRHLRQSPAAVFDYADDSSGYPRLRAAIAAYVARTRAVQCTPGQIVIVNGSHQALDLCARILLEPGQTVAIENPGYLGARRIFASHAARLQPVSIDADGIAIQDLKQSCRLVYVTPSHQFPTGVSMSVARRLELIQWASSRNAVIVEDDYSSEYRYNGPPFPALQGLAGRGAVIYIGTFSKVMFPGLRIGYVIPPRALVPVFRRAKWLADRHTAILEQCALADFIAEGHLERHVRRMRRLYGARRAALVDSLLRHFGARATVLGDAAGMHVMVRFDDPDIAGRAARNKVLLRSADELYLTRPPGREFIFGFSAIGERAIMEGIKRLAR
jgi:GntR family transcriptional regulator/MocR family aminotransferase